MSNVTDLYQYKRARRRKQELEPYLRELEKLSDFLYNNLHLRLSFDILKSVEDARIQYYMELHELNRILNLEKINKIRVKGTDDES